MTSTRRIGSAQNELSAPLVPASPPVYADKYMKVGDLFDET
jgi:hypothetical protein